MINNKLNIIVGKDGRPSMKGTYSKMINNADLLVRRRLMNHQKDLILADYWRKYSNKNVNSFEKLQPNISFSNEILIRWGNRIELNLNNCITYNKCENIEKATNKLNSRLLFLKNSVNCPKLIFSTDEVNEQDYPIIARPFVHSKGRNFIILKTKQELVSHFNKEKYYYSAFVDKVKEYRLHVGHNRILNYLEKPAPEDKTQIAWNRSVNGEAFTNIKWSDYNKNVCIEAIKAINALGLDFGGVDVLLDKDGKAYVLEVNTSPTLVSSEYSMERYAKYFDWLCKTTKRREHWEFKEFKKASNYAWHTYHFEDREPNKEV